MRSANWFRRSVASSVLVAALHGLLWAQGAPPEFAARLDDAVNKLAAYDFGGDTAAVNALTDLIIATQNQPEQRQTLATRLAAVLATGAPQGAKDFVCRQLSVIATPAQVPAVAALLPDEKLSHMARYALERIPGPAADEALRQALGKVKGKLLVGVINSLGSRRDVHGVADLARLVSDPDVSVATAAAAALGKIGPVAQAALAPALTSAAPAVRPAVAEALLLCADQLTAQGKRAEGAAIYDRVRAAELPPAVRVAATRGTVLARQKDGASLLLEQLRSSEARFFALGLTLVRELPGPEVTQAIVAELGRLPAEKQVPLLQALADRGCHVATPAILRLAKEGVPPIRSAALQTLAKLGDATQVPTLLDAAADSDASVAQAAVAALANLRGPDVDAALLAALGKAEAQRRRVTIAVLGQRRVATATAALLQAAQDPDQATRAAALKALGETATAADVAALVDLLVKAKDAQDRGAAEPALATVCQRLPDKDAAAEKLVAVLSQASSETKVALVRVLGQISGGKALAAVQQAVRDGNETVRDTAVRILGDWQDLAAAEALLNLAKNTDSKKYKILALRGYIRLIGQHPAADQKLAMCQTALGLAERDDERKLVLGVLGGVPTAEALALVLPHLDNAAMKNEASAAAVAIGDKLAASRAAPVAEAMKKVLQVTDNDDLKKRAQTVLQRAEKK